MKNKKKKSNFSIRRLVYNDKSLIICSIIAAIVIWVLSSMNLSPDTTKKINVPVSIDFSGTIAEQLGIEYFGNNSVTVDVTVSCKKYLVRDIDENDITAVLQTNTITSTGYQTVPIIVSAADDAEFTIESYYPSSLAGFYDVVQEISKPVELNYVNTGFAAEGYVAGDTTLNQSNVIIRGARTYVTNVNSVVADIKLESELTESQVVNLVPVALDSNGAPVDNVEIVIPEGETALIATVPILKVQNLPPSVIFIGGPNDPESFLDIEYSVKSIQVGALESAQLTTLNLGNISFADLNLGKNTFDFDPNTVSGIKVLDGTEEVTVTVTVPEDYAVKRIPISKSDIVAELPNYVATITSVSQNSITVVGDKSALEGIDKSSLTYTLAPLEGDEPISEKTVQCRLSVSINGNGKCWILGFYTVTVNITEK